MARVEVVKGRTPYVRLVLARPGPFGSRFEFFDPELRAPLFHSDVSDAVADLMQRVRLQESA